MIGDALKRLLMFALLCAGGAAWGGTVVEPTLELTAEERYDDAAMLRTGDGAAGQLMTKLSPKGGFKLSTPTLESSAWYTPDVLFRHGSGTVGLDHRGQLDLRTSLSRRVDLSGRAQVWRVSDPTSLPRLGMARSLSPVLYGKLELALRGELTERWEARGIYRFEGAQVYEAGRAPGLTHAPSLESWYALSRRFGVGAEYRFQWFALGAQTAHAHGAFAAARYRITRQVGVTARAGPAFFTDHQTGSSGVVPRVALDLVREGERVDLGFTAGQDLVGASGFTTALWADYASVMAAWRPVARLRLFGAASWFMNGRAPGNGLGALGGAGSQGYAVGAGVEWRASEAVSLVGAVDRYAQVGAELPGEGVDLARNIVSARLVVTPF